MATWKKDNNATMIEFQQDDLMSSGVMNTKKVLDEVIQHKTVKLSLNESQPCDGAGMQLMLFFIREIKLRGGVVDFGRNPKESGDLSKTEWERILTLFGVEDFALCEEELIDGTGER